MKKISLLLLTTLMVTSAYSGGPTDGEGDALSDDQFKLLLSQGVFGRAEGPEGSDGDENVDVAVHDQAALRRAAGEEEAESPEEEERDGVVASKGPAFDICYFFRTVGEGAQVTIRGARNQLKRVPKIECPCVQRKLKQGEAAVDELFLEMRCWFDALQKRHDEALDKRKPKEPAEGTDVAELRKELAESEAKLVQQDKQLAELRANIEKFRPLFDAIKDQNFTTS